MCSLFYLVNIKVVNDGVKTGVQVVQQGHHLQVTAPTRSRKVTSAHPLVQNRNRTDAHLHRGALRRDGGEPNDVTEVDGDGVEGFGLNRLTSLQLLRHRAEREREYCGTDW